MKRRYWLVVDALILILLLTIAGLWYLTNHAYGAWGDDAPGYIYAASELYYGQPLVKQDMLVQDALAWFKDERWSRFVAPAHHEIISPQGWTVSRYPLGLSGLMAVTAWLTGSSYGFYIVVPLLAMLIIALVYIGAVWHLPLSQPYKRVAGIAAVSLIMGADLFSNYAMAQPMREIPSMALFISALYIWCVGLMVQIQSKFWRYTCFGLAGLLFAYAVGIRETTAILLPVFIILWWPKRRMFNWKTAAVAAGIGAIIGYSFFAVQAVSTSLHKEKFRTKDVTSLAITANFDHIQSLSPTNLFNNQGKFKPGVGGLEQYWEVTNQFNVWPLFLLFAATGFIGLWLKQRTWAFAAAYWVISVVVLFGMWINPYARYILPILPILAWLSAYGMFVGVEWLTKQLQLSPRWATALVLLTVATLAASQWPAIQTRQAAVLSEAPIDRAINADDAKTLEGLAKTVQDDAASTQNPPLLLMLGTLKGGLAETIMSHTDLQVIRYPSKPNEQPPYDQLFGYLHHLQESYTVYVWYDATVSALEQKLYGDLARTPLSVYNLSIQEAISIERVN